MPRSCVFWSNLARTRITPKMSMLTHATIRRMLSTVLIDPLLPLFTAFSPFLRLCRRLPRRLFTCYHHTSKYLESKRKSVLNDAKVKSCALSPETVPGRSETYWCARFGFSARTVFIIRSPFHSAMVYHIEDRPGQDGPGRSSDLYTPLAFAFSDYNDYSLGWITLCHASHGSVGAVDFGEFHFLVNSREKLPISTTARIVPSRIPFN